MLLDKRKASHERRSHLRVDDNIVLMWRPVEAKEVPKELAHEENHLFFYPLESQLNLLRTESGVLLKHMQETSPVLAEYLDILERRLGILTRAISARNEIAAHRTQAVNLSASGIAFMTDKHYPVNTLLELKIILPPTLYSMKAYGRVVDLFENDDKASYTIGVSFVRLNEHDRAHLAQHVARRQALLKLMQATKL